MKDFNVILFDGFETLDVFGPVAVIGKLPTRYGIKYYSMAGGIIAGGQNTEINTLPFASMEGNGILLVPGGMGTRKLVDDASFIHALIQMTENAECVLSVCTGAALLAKAGLLDGKRATTNKMAWDFVTAHGKAVAWDKEARWIRDGKCYTSAGVSAGIDMALGYVADAHGINTARDVTKYIEYAWDESDKDELFAHLVKG